MPRRDRTPKYPPNEPPFVIRSWQDPGLSYKLRNLDAFRELYEPQGFYIATGPHANHAIKRLRERAGVPADGDAGSVGSFEPESEPVVEHLDDEPEVV